MSTTETEKEEGVALTSIDTPSGSDSKEDWIAAIAGLVILGVALLGLIPSGVIY